MMITKEDFIQRCQVWKANGGKWRSTNQAYKPGDHAPQAFEYQTESGPYPASMGFTIYAIIGEQKYVFWKGYHYWNDIRNKSLYLSLGANGEICTGENYEDHDMYYEMVTTNGQVMHILNQDKIINANEITSIVKTLADGEWHPLPTLEWKRIL